MVISESSLRRDQYLGYPIKIFEGTFTSGKDSGCQTGKGCESPIDVKFALHPNNSKRIIVNVPGIAGDIDGYAEKYKKLATHIQKSNLAAVVRIYGYDIVSDLPDILLRAALEYIRKNAYSICGEPEPEVFLMGFSAGASAVSAIAHEYNEVKGILLYAPSEDMPEKSVKNGLKRFRGNVIVVQGEEDEVVGPESGKKFYNYAVGARRREVFMIPNCSHHFVGEVNGRIVSEAPFYAFARKDSDRPKFPDSEEGIKLYD